MAVDKFLCILATADKAVPITEQGTDGCCEAVDIGTIHKSARILVHDFGDARKASAYDRARKRHGLERHVRDTVDIAVLVLYGGGYQQVGAVYPFQGFRVLERPGKFYVKTTIFRFPLTGSSILFKNVVSNICGKDL